MTPADEAAATAAKEIWNATDALLHVAPSIDETSAIIARHYAPVIEELERDHRAMERLRRHEVDAVAWQDEETFTTGSAVLVPHFAAWPYGCDHTERQGWDDDPAEAILKAK